MSAMRCMIGMKAVERDCRKSRGWTRIKKKTWIIRRARGAFVSFHVKHLQSGFLSSPRVRFHLYSIEPAQSSGGVCPVRCHLRMVAVLAVGLIAYTALIQAFHLMNQASDRSLYSGIAVIFGLILLVPVVVREIWRRL